MVGQKIETTVGAGGKIELGNLPFEQGTRVEVIVLQINASPKPTRESLRGSVHKYERPFDSAADPEDREASREAGVRE